MANHMNVHFTDFLREIRLTDDQVSELKSAHETLRDRLHNYEELKDIIVDTFLQGSYKRSTIIRPEDGSRADVDIVIVTNLDKDELEPDAALEKFRPFLEEYYDGRFRKQGRSWGIEMTYVDLDLVPTSAPSEIDKSMIKNDFVRSSRDIEDIFREGNKTSVFESMRLLAKSAESPQWKDEPLYIPNRDADKWERTHPLEQIRWTIEKNKNCNGHYVNVVKALKWWRKVKYPDVKHPKSYPLEHFIGDCCPDGIDSVAQGITETLETIVEDYPAKPFLPDRGVPEHDVFERLTEEDYNEFHKAVKMAAKTARSAYGEKDASKAAARWRSLLGDEFPPGSDENGNKLTERKEPSPEISRGRFA